ncbi:MAG: ribonuclease T2 [Methylococcaceae bacterium]|nr:ribonuclease T2 [Methylococcaceae bacterium]
MRLNLSMRMGIVLLSHVITSGAAAFYPEEGDFLASQNCQAYTSTKHQRNPGKIRLKAGEHYQANGLNQADGKFVQIVVPDADPAQRWVSLDCGELETGQQAPVGENTDEPPATAGPAEYLLSISWQPSFCKLHSDKKECQTETPIRYDATHFTLHGLWPQPKGNEYCGVSPRQKQLDQNHRWDALPKPDVSTPTYQRMEEMMPGVQSSLDHHEWIRHGVCDGRSADIYFTTALNLAEQINQSDLRDLISSHIGKRVSRVDIQAAFAKSFGESVRNKISVHCDGGLLSEMRIYIGRPNPDSKLQDLLSQGKAQPSQCETGLVEQVE